MKVCFPALQIRWIQNQKKTNPIQSKEQIQSNQKSSANPIKKKSAQVCPPTLQRKLSPSNSSSSPRNCSALFRTYSPLDALTSSSAVQQIYHTYTITYTIHLYYVHKYNISITTTHHLATPSRGVRASQGHTSNVVVVSPASPEATKGSRSASSSRSDSTASGSSPRLETRRMRPFVLDRGGNFWVISGVKP